MARNEYELQQPLCSFNFFKNQKFKVVASELKTSGNKRLDLLTIKNYTMATIEMKYNSDSAYKALNQTTYSRYYGILNKVFSHIPTKNYLILQKNL